MNILKRRVVERICWEPVPEGALLGLRHEVANIVNLDTQYQLMFFVRDAQHQSTMAVHAGGSLYCATEAFVLPIGFVW